MLLEQDLTSERMPINQASIVMSTNETTGNIECPTTLDTNGKLRSGWMFIWNPPLIGRIGQMYPNRMSTTKDMM